MSLKAQAKHGLGLSRRMMEGIIEGFQSTGDWLYQAHPKANHALWIVGHIALADNMFASKFREETANKPDGYEEIFWFGTDPDSDASKYPPVDEVLSYFRERRENLLQVLEDLSEEELSGPAPPADERSPLAGAPSIGHAFHFAAYHEGIHTGQLTVCHRGLGNPPIYQPENVPVSDGA